VVLLGAGLAAASVTLGAWRHADWRPVVPAVGGAAIVGWTQLVSYAPWLELAGFALLAAAVVREWRRAGTDRRAAASLP
jgi:hypothetical protein